MLGDGRFSVVPVGLWFIFTIGIVVLLVLDLGVASRRTHQATIREAVLESAGWIFISLVFNIWFGFYFGPTLGVEFFTGYVVEKSLSIDNLFVILMIFDSMKVSSEDRHRVLFFGILGAILMRGVLILMGASLIHRFHWILYVFGFILIMTAIKFIRDMAEEMDVKENPVLKLLRRFMPITQQAPPHRFFVIEKGQRKATHLFVALVMIEATDLVFAFDSIPAVLAVTQDPFVAFASNILAVLGLRALYFVIVDWIKQLRYLKPGLAAVLGFVGLKMLLSKVFPIPSWVSLLVIIGILSTAALTSWYAGKVEKS
jgi:tellurite resistance protein TerC